jgi:hypothetical protein
MADKPPKPPNDNQKDVLGALERALRDARQRVEEAVEGLRAVIRTRESGKLTDDSGRYTRQTAKPKAVPPEHRKTKPR